VTARRLLPRRLIEVDLPLERIPALPPDLLFQSP